MLFLAIFGLFLAIFRGFFITFLKKLKKRAYLQGVAKKDLKKVVFLSIFWLFLAIFGTFLGVFFQKSLKNKPYFEKTLKKW